MLKKIFYSVVGVTVVVFLSLLIAIGYSISQTPEPQAVVDTTPSITTSQTEEGIKNITTVASEKSDLSRLYPDPTLTPGDVLTSDVSQICMSGYTATVRDVPLSEKKEVYAEYGVSYPQPTGTYEVDHFIPLELGGSNDIKNLWLEPASPTPGFHQKDQFENYEHREVCSGAITIQEAQQRMVTDWYKYWLQETGSNQGINTQSVTKPQTTAGTSDPEVKKSSTGICHKKGTTYYDRTINFTPYNSIEACLASGGRLPK